MGEQVGIASFSLLDPHGPIGGTIAVPRKAGHRLRSQSVFRLSNAAIAFAGALFTIPAAAATQYSFYASPTGTGSTCSESFPCSLAAVQTKVRSVNSSMKGDVVVYLRGGTYSLTQAWNFTQADSGSGGYQVIYSAYSGEKPVISGGKTVTGWRIFDRSKNIYRAFVGTTLQTRQLFVDGFRAQRARGPYNPGGYSFNANYGFDTTDTSLQNLGHVNDVEIVALNEWKVLRCGVTSIVGNKVTMNQPCWTNALRHHVKFDRVTWLENAYEFLDEEGEWYLDRGTGYIYYKPRLGENIANAQTIVPVTERLLVATGSLGNPIHNIVFTGLRFSYNTWLRPNTAEGYPPIQAGFLYYNSSGEAVDGFKTPAAVSVTFANSITFKRNTFEKIGSAGLNFETGSQDNLVIGNVFRDISSSAIQLGHINASHPSDSREILKRNTISNNFITEIGREYYDGVGIFAAYTENTTIEHNELTRLPYSGISVGWGWGRPDVGGALGFTSPTAAQQNKIRYNSITKFMMTLRDGGGIYTLGSQPSSTINDNYINQMASDYGGIYLDEATQFYDVNNNVVSRVPRWLYIWTSTIRNNSVRFNYSDTISKMNNGASNTVSANQEGISSWPVAARAIISSAGLEPSYADIRSTVVQSADLALVRPTVNLAFERPTTSSSVYSSAFGAENATDGDLSSGWSPSGTDARPWIQVDLGSASTIKKIEFVSRQDLDQPTTRRDFEVRGSNDPSFTTSTVLGSQSSAAFEHQSTWSATVTNSTAYRYVRLAKTVDGYLFVNEFRVLAGAAGSGSASITPTP